MISLRAFSFGLCFYFPQEAANMRVSVEFVIFKQKSSHLNFIEEDANGLIRRISDIDGCSLELYLPGRRRTMVYSPTHIL